MLLQPIFQSGALLILIVPLVLAIAYPFFLFVDAPSVKLARKLQDSPSRLKTQTPNAGIICDILLRKKVAVAADLNTKERRKIIGKCGNSGNSNLHTRYTLECRKLN